MPMYSGRSTYGGSPPYSGTMTMQGLQPGPNATGVQGPMMTPGRIIGQPQTRISTPWERMGISRVHPPRIGGGAAQAERGGGALEEFLRRIIGDEIFNAFPVGGGGRATGMTAAPQTDSTPLLLALMALLSTRGGR